MPRSLPRPFRTTRARARRRRVILEPGEVTLDLDLERGLDDSPRSLTGRARRALQACLPPDLGSELRSSSAYLPRPATAEVAHIATRVVPPSYEPGVSEALRTRRRPNSRRGSVRWWQRRSQSRDPRPTARTQRRRPGLRRSRRASIAGQPRRATLACRCSRSCRRRARRPQAGHLRRGSSSFDRHASRRTAGV
jgi:hypothetical protein